MSLNSWKLAQTGAAFTQDPRMSLRNFIYDNWTVAGIYSDADLARQFVHIDTKFDNTSKTYAVIVEKLVTDNAPQVLGKQRVRAHDHCRIQVFARGFNSIDKSYKMVQFLDDLLGANPTALRTSGIDEIVLGSFNPINTQDERPSTGQAKSQLITRYWCECTLIYDKYLS